MKLGLTLTKKEVIILRNILEAKQVHGYLNNRIPILTEEWIKKIDNYLKSWKEASE